MRNILYDFIQLVFVEDNTPKYQNEHIQINKITINEDYRKKWNEHSTDFVCITNKDGELLRPTLYRIGGMGNPDLRKDEYFTMLKYIEDFYPKHIMEASKSKDPKHLKGVWCIIDKFGNEKQEFKQFKTPSLIKDSCIYTLDNEYYNIETGELYCKSYGRMESTEFLFLENRYDKDKSRHGVFKINKKTGEYEIIK